MGAPLMPLLRIQLLGDFQLIEDGVAVTQLNRPRLHALLAYLLLHRQAPQSRQQIAFLFYPDSTEAQAHTNLRQLLHVLRRSWPGADCFLSIEASTLAWRMDTPFEARRGHL